ERNVCVQPDEAYGPVRPDGFFKEVPKENLPPDALEADTVPETEGPAVAQFSVRVHEVKEESVIIDLNHPMAGKTLMFEVKVLAIQPSLS
ncbi:MAG: FKBP-type peptidyl-prolyl cis-trans isomerase, partial [Pyrinomonadaceae bacterium]